MMFYLLELIINGYEGLFLSLYAVLGNYGWSIILLSVIVSLLLIPAIKFGEKIATRHHEYDAVLNPQLQKIKSESDGETQYRRIRALYARYHYSPFKSILKIMPLLVQIPVLILTYYMLDNLVQLAGVSFYWFENLSSPDNLFYGINLLPIMMTVFNLLSVFTMPGLTRQDWWQLSIIAFLFLVLLYNQSSGILLYWTMNNAILLCKNLLFSPVHKNKLNQTLSLRITLKEIGLFLTNKYTFISLVYLAILWNFVSFVDYLNAYAFRLSIVAGIPLFIILFTLESIKCHKLLIYALCVIYTLIFSILGFTEELYLKSVVFTMLFFVGIYLSLLNRSQVLPEIKRIVHTNLSIKQSNWLLSGFLCFILFILLIDAPFNIYTHNANSFPGISPLEITSLFLAIFISAASVVFILIRFLPEFIKHLLMPLVAFLAILFFSYTKFIVPDYGVMDNFIFVDSKALRYSNVFFAVEFIAWLAILFIIFLNIKRLSFYLNKALVFLFLVSTVITVIHVSKTTESMNIDVQPEEILPASTDYTIALSPQEKNVFIILLDGFAGGFLPDLIKKDTQIEESLKDFVWYKNALASGSSTIAALSGIVGGHQFTVDAVIDSGRDQVGDVMQSAYSVMLDAFAEQGYNISWVNPVYHPAPLELNRKISVFETRPDDAQLDKSHMEMADAVRMLSILSVFKAILISNKIYLYDNGNWRLNHGSEHSIHRKWAHVEFLEQLTQKEIKVSEKPTFTFIHLDIPHPVWIVNADGERADSEYADEAQYALRKLGLLFERMKAAGVYAKTQIQVISDHGWWLDNPMFDADDAEFTRRGHLRSRIPGLFHALMLIKEPDHTAEQLTVSDSLVTNADVTGVACAMLDDGCDGVSKRSLHADDGRMLKYNNLDSSIYRMEGFGDSLRGQWQVRDNIFAPENWERLR